MEKCDCVRKEKESTTSIQASGRVFVKMVLASIAVIFQSRNTCFA